MFKAFACFTNQYVKDMSGSRKLYASVSDNVDRNVIRIVTLMMSLIIKLSWRAILSHSHFRHLCFVIIHILYFTFSITDFVTQD